jgi:hypothetical protein
MFGELLKLWCFSILAVAKTTSPSVAHELAVTTTYEKSLAIFSRVSLVVKATGTCDALDHDAGGSIWGLSHGAYLRY